MDYNAILSMKILCHFSLDKMSLIVVLAIYCKETVKVYYCVTNTCFYCLMLRILLAFCKTFGVKLTFFLNIGHYSFKVALVSSINHIIR